MPRPRWDDVWMNCAKSIGLRSRCIRAEFGCVIVSPLNEVIAVSYVGPPANFYPANVHPTDKCDFWCSRSTGADLPTDYSNCVSIHAEQNAIARSDYAKTKGATLYVNGMPCLMCAKVILAAGIRRVVVEMDKGGVHREPTKVEQFFNDNDVYIDFYTAIDTA